MKNAKNVDMLDLDTKNPRPIVPNSHLKNFIHDCFKTSELPTSESKKRYFIQVETFQSGQPKNQNPKAHYQHNPIKVQLNTSNLCLIRNTVSLIVIEGNIIRRRIPLEANFTDTLSSSML